MCIYSCLFPLSPSPLFTFSPSRHQSVPREPSQGAGRHRQPALSRWGNSQPPTGLAEEWYGHHQQAVQTAHPARYTGVSVCCLLLLLHLIIIHSDCYCLKRTLEWELPACVSFPVSSHCLYVVLLIYLRCRQRGWLVCLNHIRSSIGSQRVNPVYWSALSLKFISNWHYLFSDQ